MGGLHFVVKDGGLNLAMMCLRLYQNFEDVCPCFFMLIPTLWFEKRARPKTPEPERCQERQ